MRYAFVEGLPEWLSFNNIKHAHSHVALLGWLHAGLYIFIVFLYKLRRTVYQKLYWITQLTVLGMLISFPIQGYKLFSIIFTSLFIFLSYYFIYLVFRDLKKREKEPSITFLKTSLFFLFLSSLGTWALAFIMKSALKGSAVYYGAIQFYLHFQFNGWLIFGILALFFKLLSRNNIHVPPNKIRNFYRLLLLSTFLTFAIAVTWSTPLPYLFLINSIGVLIQLWALIYFIKLIQGIIPQLKNILSRNQFILLSVSLLSFILKIIIQTMVVIPYIATISYGIRNFVIGFIHLLMLGCLSLFFIALYQHFISINKKTLTGIKIFVVGIVISELVLFLQGILLWSRLGFFPFYYETILAVSILMPLGLIIFFYNIRGQRRLD